MNYIYMIPVLFLLYLYNKSRNHKENFQDINEAFKIPNKKCTSIYGNYHPRCMSTSRLKHVGYFKINTTKYPLLDLKAGNYIRRYVMLKDRFAKLNKKFWNRAHYFRNPFYYHKSIPFSVVFNYIYRGMMINTHTRKKFYVFGKRINYSDYKYILFREKNGILQYAYKLPYRRKLSDGDSVYVRNKMSTYGPFVYYKN